jgi:solute carrier family 25 (mitochondrial phosphate transporter), member 23/24/25/41
MINTKPICEDHSKTSLSTRLCIGGLAGIISRTIVAPIELCKIHKQTPFIPNTNISYVLQHEGFLGLWKGNGINCMRVFPQTAIHYVGNGICFDILQSYSTNSYAKNNLIAGSICGIIGSICTYPLETIRSHFSVQVKKSHYSSVFEAFSHFTWKKCYNGVSMHILGHVPFNALTFTFYRQYKKIYKEHHPLVRSLIAGGLAGIQSIVITYPTDVIRRRLQLQGFDENVPKYTSVSNCVNIMYKKEGITSFYRGLSFGMLKMTIAMSLQFTLFEALQEQWKNTNIYS